MAILNFIGGGGGGASTLQTAYVAGNAIVESLADGPVSITNPPATAQSALVVVQGTAGQFAADFTGDVRVTGKLTVTGLIDPTGVYLDEQVVDQPAVANKGVVYTKDVAGITQLFYRADDGTVTQLTPGGAGDSLQASYNGGNTILETLVGGAVTISNPAASAHAVLTLSQGTAGQFALDATGDCRVTGKLTVTGLIDPSGIYLDEQGADLPAIANKGVAYTKDVAGVTQLFYRADDGTVTQLTPIAGTPTWATVLAAGNTSGATPALMSVGTAFSSVDPTLLFGNVANPLTLVAIGNGTSAAAPSNIVIQATDSSAAGVAGANLTLKAGAGLVAGAGGTLNLFAGSSPTGTPGDAVLQAGQSLSIFPAGITRVMGALGGPVSGAGGAVVVQGGPAIAGPGDPGGPITMLGGNGFATGSGGPWLGEGGPGQPAGPGAFGGTWIAGAGTSGGVGATPGATATLHGGQSRGAATGGSILFQTSGSAAAPGVLNPLVTALTIDTTQKSTFSGDVHVTGKLTVDGLIDPTGLYLDEQAANQPAIANKGVLYTKDVAGVTQLFYRADDGTVTQITPVAGTSTWAAVLAAGNTTGATVPLTTGGTAISSTTTTLQFGNAANPLVSIRVGNGLTNAAPTTITYRGTDNTTAGVAGSPLVFATGVGGSAAAPGTTIKFQTPWVTGAGTTLADALVIEAAGSVYCPGVNGAVTETRFGSGSIVTGANSSGFGKGVSVSGPQSAAFGESANGDTGSFQAIFGQAATGQGFTGVSCFGRQSTTTGDYGIAIGNDSSAATHQFVAGSTTAFISDVYFGNGSSNAAPQTVTVHGTDGLGAAVVGGIIRIGGGLAGDAATAGGDLILSVAIAGTGTALTDIVTILGATGDITLSGDHDLLPTADAMWRAGTPAARWKKVNTTIESYQVSAVQVADFTFDETATTWYADTTAGGFTGTLPSAAATDQGTVFMAFNGGAAPTTLKIAPAGGDTLNGAGAIALTTPFESIFIQRVGATEWVIF